MQQKRVLKNFRTQKTESTLPKVHSSKIQLKLRFSELDLMIILTRIRVKVMQ
jgi:hypothetical protein